MTKRILALLLIATTAAGFALVVRPVQAATKWQTFSFTTSAGNHLNLKYPANWTLGKFENYPENFTLQPSDTFQKEATKNAIFISITGHCMNTQCLTVLSLNDMVRETGAKVIRKTSIKGATGYHVRFSDKSYGYMFIKGDDLIKISTDIYPTWMRTIVQTMSISPQ